MIVLTGGAGFIGSCILARLNELGREDVIVVDRLDEKGLKKRNLENKKLVGFVDKADFLVQIKRNHDFGGVSHVVHMGACSSTTGTDRQYYILNNYEYSREVALWSDRIGARLIYASSAATYGDGESGYSDSKDSIRLCQPLNYYGESKQLFDEWVLDNGFYDKIVGLKFFNVYGPNEYHKGDMKSVIAKAFERVVSEGRMKLFRSYRAGVLDGEQRRDFVYVKDVVDVILFLMEHKNVNGIYNLGTGEARTWNDLARALFAAVRKVPDIQYFDMPEHLRSRYQYFTQAEMSSLRSVGYEKPFLSLEKGIADYVTYLNTGRYW